MKMGRSIILAVLILTLFSPVLTGCGTKSVAEMKADKDISGLTGALSSDDNETRIEAIKALGEIGDKSASNDLVKMLRDPNQNAREEAATALDNLRWTPTNDIDKAYYLIAKGNWGEAASLGNSTVKACLQFLQYDDVKDKALDCILQIGEPAIPSLINALKDYATQNSATAALEAIGEPVEEPLLTSLREDKDWQDQTVALEILDHLGWAPRSPPTGTNLIIGSRTGEGEMTVKNGLEWDAVIILSKDDASHENVKGVFIKANETYTISGIPDGKFILYDTLGKDWDNKAGQFTITEERSRFEDTFSFETNWNKGQYTTWQVTLYPVRGGSAQTTGVDEADFPKLN